ncbi:CLIP-associated protein [Diplonema papillatum]|nr:CLIP-associated protein [Diplonema papillatum]
MVVGGLCSPGKARVRKMLEGKADEESELVGSPVTVSESELKNELSAIGALAWDTKNPDWMKRVKALQRFRCLLAGESYNCAHFIPYMRDYMREQLNVALQDLRSAVCKEACQAVAHLCRVLPANTWEAMSDWYLVALFKVSVTTIAIISQSGSRCLRYLAKNGRFSMRAVAVILSPAHFENKHATYRQTVYQTMLPLLHKIAPADFLGTRHHDCLNTAIQQGVVDPVSEVRKISRLIFWALHALHSPSAKMLLDTLDPSVRRSVIEDETLFNTITAPLDPDWELLLHSSGLRKASNAGPTALQQELLLSAASPKKATQRSVSAHATPGDRKQSAVAKAAAAAAAAKRGSAQRSTTPLPTKTGLAAAFGGSNPEIPTIQEINQSTQRGKERGRPYRNSTASSDRDRAVSPLAGHGSPPAGSNGRDSRTPADPPVIERGQSLGSCTTSGGNGGGVGVGAAQRQSVSSASSRSATVGHANGSAAATTAASSAGAGGVEKPAGSSPRLVRRVPSAGSKRATGILRQGGGRQAVRDTVSSASTSSNQHHSPSLGSTEGGASSEAPDADDEGVVQLERAITLAQGGQLADKITGLETIVRVTRNHTAVSLRHLRGKLPYVMHMNLSMLRDPSVEISTTSMVCIGSVAEAFQDTPALEPHLEKIFLSLFTKLGSNASVHQAAVSLLEKLLECGQTRVLFPVLLKVLECNNSQVQLGCLEYLLHLMQFSQDYLSRSSNMRQGIVKFLKLVNSANSDVRGASITCLGVLHGSSSNVFCEEVLTLSLSDQASIKQCLLKTVPGLNGELKAAEGRVRAKPSPAMAVTRTSTPAFVEVKSDVEVAVAQWRNNTEKQLSADGLKDLPARTVVKSPSCVRVASGGRAVAGAGKVKTAPGDGKKKAVGVKRVVSSLSHGSSSQAGPWATLTSAGSAAADKIGACRRILAETAPWPPAGELHKYLAAPSSFALPSHSSFSLLHLFADDDHPTELRLSAMDVGLRIAARLASKKTTPNTTQATTNLFKAVLAAYCDSDPKVSDHAGVVLETLVMQADEKDCAHVVGSELHNRGPTSENEEIPFLFELLEKVVGRMGANGDDLLAIATGFVQSLYDGFLSNRAEVRKVCGYSF